MSVIGFVILHYGNVQVTKECIDSILQLHTEDDIHVVVVDNDTNKSAEERQKLKDTVVISSMVEVIQMQEKSGFSRANNEGYMYIKEMYNPDYIVMANNDIVFAQKDFVKRLKDIYEECPYEVLGPDIVNRENGQHQSPIDVKGRSLQQVNYTIWMNAICLKLFPIVYPFLQMNYNRSKEHSSIELIKERQSDIVPCGACIIVSGNFINKENVMFTPETNFYYEEYILHERCRRNGYRILFSSEIQVIHGDGIATKGKTESEKKRMRFRMEETLEAAKLYRKILQQE